MRPVQGLIRFICIMSLLVWIIILQTKNNQQLYEIQQSMAIDCGFPEWSDDVPLEK